MRETFTNAYQSIRTNAPIYADTVKRAALFAWHLASSSASSVWQFVTTNSSYVWNRARGTQPAAATNAGSPQAASGSDVSTASFVYTQVTKPVNWLYERASVNLPAFLRTQPSVSPVAPSAPAAEAASQRPAV